MTKRVFFTAALLVFSLSTFVAAPSFAQDCSNVNDIYEMGVDKGRADAAQYQGDHAKKAAHQLQGITKHQRKCFKKGYHIGYDNVAADLHKSGQGSGYRVDNPYSPGSNEYEYYEDGCRAGAQDGSNNMSSVYERYDDQYDSRFEKPFKKGYETCWTKYR
jgi:hypothetical protein